MLRKYVTAMVPLVGLLKYVTDFREITSEKIDKNVKSVTKWLNVSVRDRYLFFSDEKHDKNLFKTSKIIKFFRPDGRTGKLQIKNIQK